MLSAKRILTILFGTQENVFLGAFFLIFRRVYKSNFGTFSVPCSWSRAHFYARFLNNKYESEERLLVDTHLKEGDHVLELGACVGVVSCLTSKKIKGGRHCVVEANPHLLPYLYKNKARNHSNFTILGAAISQDRQLLFHLNKNMVGGSSERVTKHNYDIAGIPLEWATQRFGPFNTLIMDIEGGEELFIKNYISELSLYNKLIIEFHPSILGEKTISTLQEKLIHSGFRCLQSIGDVDYWERSHSA